MIDDGFIAAMVYCDLTTDVKYVLTAKLPYASIAKPVGRLLLIL